ncbi:MAG: hypothetical protein NXH95_03640 [Pseudomonadaceae bacterium]|nr:hypothetical protein [Pseudomonadaceae bacterium]
MPSGTLGKRAGETFQLADREDLTEVAGNNTLVTLVQLAPAQSAFGAASGWHEAFERLKDYLERGVTVTNPQRFDELKELYATLSSSNQDDSNTSGGG